MNEMDQMPLDAVASDVSQSQPEAMSAPELIQMTQAELNERMGKARIQGRDSGRREALSQQQQPQAPQGMGGMAAPSQDQIQQMVSEATQRHMREQQQLAYAQNVASQFVSKMAAGEAKYPDFKQVIGDLDLANLPEIVELANSADNTADVMYELAKHPSKIGALLQLQQRSPKLAAKEMLSLSASIQKNEEAQKQALPKDPLSPVTPSANVGGDNGKLSMNDLRQQPWLRG